jgi:pyruvate ferredoxin oxidoreductase alpha subunit
MYLSRDTGWLSICATDAQEVYDLSLMAFKISEKVRLPMIVNQDGLLTSHTVEGVKPLNDKDAYNFVGEYKPYNSLLDTEKAVTYGAQTEEDWHFEHKARQHHDIMKSRDVILDTFKEFEKLTGRKYEAFKEYKVEDAEVVIVCMGSTFGTTCVAVDKMRKNGAKVGVFTHRVIRPFPMEDIIEKLQHVKVVAVLDRSSPGGAMGAFFNEYSASFINKKNKPLICNYIYGLGGRDMTVDMLCEIFETLQKDKEANKLTHDLQSFIGLRGPKISFFGQGE